MIFVTVGHQMPFDRLIQAMDTWAESTGRGEELFAQIGRGAYHPKHFETIAFLAPAEFQRRLSQCDAVVGHAGTGTIIAAHEHNKPLLVLPRSVEFRETRNDHQFATARYFAEKGYILAAADEHELQDLMSQVERFQPCATIAETASEALLKRIRSFITAT